MEKMKAVNLLFTDARGIFIPRDFVLTFHLEKFTGISEWAENQCKNEENANYWDAWDSILNNAEYVDIDGNKYSLYQDGDLWLICFDRMSTEEKENFGFEE